MASNSKINCGFINIQSVGNKTLDIHDLIIDDCLDVFAVVETWLTEVDNAKIIEMTPNTHSFFHEPRKSGGRGGGVGLFLSNSFSGVRIMKIGNSSCYESMQVNCSLDGRLFVFVVIYRPPNTNTRIFLEDFSDYLESIDTVAARVFILGDFNFWYEVNENRSTVEFRELMETFQFSNCVDKITTNTGHMLDIVYSNMTNGLVNDMSVDDVCTISPVRRLDLFYRLISQQIQGKQ